jgi:hypothetical protein
MSRPRYILEALRRPAETIPWFSLQRLLNVPGQTLARRKTDDIPKGLQPNSRRFVRSRRYLT